MNKKNTTEKIKAMDAPKPTSLRLPPELKDRLDTIAKAEHRSLNNLIGLILQDYVDRYDSETHS